MGPIEVFETLAEIAIAIVGFSGIVLALGRRAVHQLDVVKRAQLIDLFLAGFGVVFFAFVPSWLYSLSNHTEWSWRIAHGLLGMYIVISICVFVWLTHGLRQQIRLNLVFAPIGIAVVGALITIALGHFSDLAFTIYYGSLLFLMFIAVLEFFLLIWSFGEARE